MTEPKTTDLLRDVAAKIKEAREQERPVKVARVVAVLAGAAALKRRNEINRSNS